MFLVEQQLNYRHVTSFIQVFVIFSLPRSKFKSREKKTGLRSICYFLSRCNVFYETSAALIQISLLEGKLYSEQSGLLGDPSIRRQRTVIQCHPVFLNPRNERTCEFCNLWSCTQTFIFFQDCSFRKHWNLEVVWTMLLVSLRSPWATEFVYQAELTTRREF